MNETTVSGLLGAASLVASGSMLAAATGIGALRLHGEEPLRSPFAFALRVVAQGVLAGACLTLLATASVLLLGGAPLPPPWGRLLGFEVITALGVALLLGFRDRESDGRWLLMGATVAAGTAGAGLSGLEALDLVVPLEPGTLPLAAAVLFAIQVVPGPTTRLAERARRLAERTSGDHVILVDTEGGVLHMSQATRSAIGMGAPPISRRTRQLVPKALQSLLDDPQKKKARVRTGAGRILEVSTTEVMSRGFGRRARGILVRDVTEDYEDERRLVRLAHFDSLTGLANRRLFLETLARVLETADQASDRVALYYIDLDDFKAINDTHGHASGDAMLRALADRFRSHLRSEDLARYGFSANDKTLVARLAGDEFAVIAPRIGNADSASELARFILDLIGRPLELTDRILNPSASIGVALFPKDGRDVEALLHRADSALYVAKSRGRNRIAWYEASFDARAERARVLEQGLRGALEHGEMRVHYQPKVDTMSGKLIGFEALLRWRSEELGDVGPAEFIPVAEARGLVSDLGAWCLDETCRQIRAWTDAGFEVVPVSVNVSSAQFSESDLQRVVSEALKTHGVEPRHLELELTESLLLEEGSRVESVLRDLRSIGVRIALDDFGTGYSALTYLNRFNLDVLKLDRGLLRDIDASPSALGIASAVVSMAHSLGLTVVAEGIDMHEQLPFLKEMGCDHIQGFLFSPALPAEDVARFMRKQGQHLAVFGPGMVAPGQQPAASKIADDTIDEPVLREALVPGPRPAVAAAALASRGRALLVDDGHGSLGPLAMRLDRLGIDIHYAAEVDEGHLFVAQEREAIRLLVAPPCIDLERARSVLENLTRMVGEPRRFVVIGERPEEEVRTAIREAKVDWVLWAPFNDAELRYLVKSAMTPTEDLVDRREPRVPVDLVANIWSGDRREVVVVSSLSPRGAFIEMSDPLRKGSSLRIELELPGDRFRGFARVVHSQEDDPDRCEEPSGVGVTFYGVDRDAERILRKAVSELEARYLP